MVPQGASASTTPAHAASFQGPQISVEVMQTVLRHPPHGRLKVSIGSNSYVAELRQVVAAKVQQPRPMSASSMRYAFAALVLRCFSIAQ